MSQDFTDSNKRTEDFFSKNTHLFAPMSQCQGTCGETIRKLTSAVDTLQRQLNEANARLMVKDAALVFYSCSDLDPDDAPWARMASDEGKRARLALEPLTPAFQNVLRVAAGVYIDCISNLKEGTTSWMKENITEVEHDFLMGISQSGL